MVTASTSFGQFTRSALFGTDPANHYTLPCPMRFNRKNLNQHLFQRSSSSLYFSCMLTSLFTFIHSQTELQRRPHCVAHTLIMSWSSNSPASRRIMVKRGVQCTCQ